MRYGPKEKNYPGELVDFQESPPSSLRLVCPNEWRYQETCMDEHDAHDEIQM